MTRIFTEGFEFGDMLFFNGTLGGGAAITSTNPRSGTYAFTCGTSGNTGTTETFPSALGELYFRIAIRDSNVASDAYSKICLYSGSTLVAGVRLYGNKFNYYRSTTLISTGTLPAANSTWYLLEIHLIVGNSGVFQLKVDGVLDIDYSGDTSPGSETTVDRFILFDGSTNPAFDDLALNDTTGAVDNSWCGDGHIILLKPNANGDASDLTGSDGNQTDNYLLVDEVPADGDTTYNVGDASGERDLYGIADFDGTGKTIRRVWVEARAKDTVAAGGECYLSVKVSGGTEQKSAAVPLLTTYTKQLLGTVHTVNPETSAAWSDANLDAIQVGFEVK
jgi:hypothetical protein